MTQSTSPEKRSQIPNGYLSLLACCSPSETQRQNDKDDKRLRNALEAIEKNPAAKAQFESQKEFDSNVIREINHLPVPDNLQQLAAAHWSHSKQQHKFGTKAIYRQSPFITACLAIGFLISWGVYAFVNRSQHFVGDDNVTAILDQFNPSQLASGHRNVLSDFDDLTVKETVDDLDPRPAVSNSGRKVGKPIRTNVECSQLGDILFLDQGLEHFDIPKEFSKCIAKEYRVVQYENEPVVFVTTQEPKDLFFVVFRALPLHVDIKPPGSWKVLRGDHWTAAVQEQSNYICFIAAMNSGPRKLKHYLGKSGIDL